MRLYLLETWSGLCITFLITGISIFVKINPCQSKQLIKSSSKTLLPSNDLPKLLFTENKQNSSRVQTKRQAGLANSSGRAGDPWFLDSEPPYPPQPYRFVYNVKGRNGLTEQYRQEVGDGKFLTGSYGYVLPDGIYRHVDYVADDRGFRAFIRTSEPGTANQNPADVVINSNPVPQQPFASNPQNFAASIPVNGVNQWISGSSTGYLPSSTYSRSGGNFGPLPPSDPAPSLSSSSSSGPSQASNNSSLTPINDYWTPLTGYTADPVSGLLRRPPGSIVNGNSPFSRFQSPNLTSTFSNSPSTHSFGVGDLSSLSKTKVPEPETGKSSSGNDRRQPEGSLSNLPELNFIPPIPPIPATQRQAELTNWPSPLAGYSGGLGLLPISPQVRPFRARPTLTFSDFGPTSTSSHPPTGTNKLAYDRLDGELRLTEPVAPKINYDIHQVRSLDSLPAKPSGSSNFGEVNELRSRPPPVEPASGGGGGGGGLHYIPLSGSQFSSHSHSTVSGGEEHHRRSSSSRTLQPEGKGEQVSNREQGFGSHYGSSSSFTRAEDSDNSLPDQQHQNVGRLPPPAPQFGPSQLLPSRGAGVKTLQAPYSQLSIPEPPSPPEEPSSLTGDLFANAPTKGGPQGSAWPPTTSAPPQASIRTVRMPERAEELRTTMMMHDWRSMQNTLGLPQPPRGPQAQHSSEPYLSRAQRIDALLASRGAGQASSPPAALSSPLEPPQLAATTRVPGPATTTRVPGPATTTRAPAQQQLEQRRPLSTGPLLRIHEINELSGQLGSSGNLSDPSFDARRLSSSSVLQRSTTERPSSELEKFQQRLRTQQLLLEQAKHQPVSTGNSNRSTNNSSTSSATASNQQRIHRVGAENSHVSYDDTESDLATNTINSSSDSSSNGGSRSSSKPKVSSTGGGFKWLEISGPVKVSETERSASSDQSSTAAPTSVKFERLSEFARNVQTWPSLISKSETKLPTTSNSNGSLLEVEGATEAPNNSSKLAASHGRGNTINLDFINSVTALSVDDMNPFAIASVNPAIQNLRAGNDNNNNNNRISRDQESLSSNAARLQLHKLATGEQPPVPSTGSAPSNVATLNARYSSSPELLAALAYHERRDTSGQLRNLLGSPSGEPVGSANEVGAARSLGWASNHRFAIAPSSSELHRSAAAPYMLSSASSASSRVEKQQLEGVGDKPEKSKPSSAAKPLLEVRDREVHLDNHRFYEVLSSQRSQPLESSVSFTAYRDAQLSIPALVSRRRRRRR